MRHKSPPSLERDRWGKNILNFPKQHGDNIATMKKGENLDFKRYCFYISLNLMEAVIP